MVGDEHTARCRAIVADAPEGRYSGTESSFPRVIGSFPRSRDSRRHGKHSMRWNFGERRHRADMSGIGWFNPYPTGGLGFAVCAGLVALLLLILLALTR
jgi:hypothetical protein